MKKLNSKTDNLSILTTNLFFCVVSICAVMCLVTSCGKSDKLDVKGIRELVQKNSDDITSADIDFFLDQVEILANKTKNISKEDEKAYFESLDKEEQECVMVIGMMVSAASSSKADNKKWSDAQLERLKVLKEQLK